MFVATEINAFGPSVGTLLIAVEHSLNHHKMKHHKNRVIYQVIDSQELISLGSETNVYLNVYCV